MCKICFLFLNIKLIFELKVALESSRYKKHELDFEDFILLEIQRKLCS